MGLFSKLRKSDDGGASQLPKGSASSKEEAVSSDDEEIAEFLSAWDSSRTNGFPWLKDILSENRSSLNFDKNSRVLASEVDVAEALVDWCKDEHCPTPSSLTIQADEDSKREMDIKLLELPGVSVISPTADTLPRNSYTHIFVVGNAISQFQDTLKCFETINASLRPNGVAIIAMCKSGGKTGLGRVQDEMLRLWIKKETTEAKKFDKGFSSEEVLRLLLLAKFPKESIRTSSRKTFMTGAKLAEQKESWMKGIDEQVGLGRRTRMFGPRFRDVAEQAFENVIGDQPGVPVEFEVAVITKGQ